MGARRKSRELALQFLFAQDFAPSSCRPESLEAELERFLASFEAGERFLPYTRELVSFYCINAREIDQLIRQHASNWRLERMSTVDRNILRIAAAELKYGEDVPPQVAINEALEIAKRFSTDDSVAFINGVLDALGGALTN